MSFIHNPCFNLFILYNNSSDNQGSEISKNEIFLMFPHLSKANWSEMTN